MLNESNDNLIYCINNNSLIYSYISNFAFTHNCSYFCLKKYQKMIYDTNECVDNCSDNNFLYEYNNICYNACPNGTIISSNQSHICIDKKNLICTHYYNYEKTKCLLDVPDGYFLNDTNAKTIDKCHENCETCNEKSTINNTNCLSCQISKYLDLGNCVTNCTNGHIENTNICKCSNEKCLQCSLESLTYNLCISCNKEYFPIYDDISYKGSFINCYKEPEGYFLSNYLYYKCYPTCKKCNGFGNETNHNCIECLPNYELIKDSQNNNCYNQSSNL